MDTQSIYWDSSWLSRDVPKILAIDDDALVRQSIVLYLEDCGYEVIEAANGQKGIELFRSESPDLILCDLRMPEVDGMEVLSVVTEESPDVPVIMISGAGMIKDVVEALRLGALDYLVKPLTDLDVLGHAVKQALSKKQLEFENQLYRMELEKANKELQNNLNILQNDQEAGRRAQFQLLPAPFDVINAFEFSHTVIPSLNISGDFLDYFEIDDRYIGFYIADVSGHGSASAFVTMMLKSLINQPLRNHRINDDPCILCPDKMLSYLNVELINANVGKHVTLFYGVIDQKLNQLNYAVGGHFPRPVILDGENRYIIAERGFPIGMFAWANFENYTIEIPESFTMFLFSDGVLERLQDRSNIEENELLNLTLNHQSQVIDLVEQLRLKEQPQLPDDVSIFIVRRKK